MQAIIVTTLYLLSILIPLTFTTINHELFEFPKFILLLSGTLVISATWLTHMFTTRDYSPLRESTPKYIKLIHLSVLLFLASQLLSTIFSIHPYTSFWGYYSRFHGGLLTTICYTIIYFAAIKWMNKDHTLKLIKIIVGTSFIISLYAIAQRFGIDKNLWIQDVVNRPFSTLGQPNWLAAYLLPNIFLTLYLYRNAKEKSVFPILLFAILLIALLFTRSRSGLLALALAYPTYWLLLIRQFSFAKIKHSLFLYSIFLFSILAIVGTPYTPALSSYLTRTVPVNYPSTAQGTQLENGGTESGEIRQIVWEGALRLFAKYPLLGTGVETFAYTYYWERPLAHNLTSEWDFLYNKAHNEYLNMAATTGLLGLLSYLGWHAALFFASLTQIPKSKKINQVEDNDLRHLYPVVGASVLGFAVTNFFGFSVIPVYLAMIILAAFITTMKQTQIPPTPIPSKLYVILPLVLLYPLSLYRADLSYAKGKAYLDVGQADTALPFLQNAASLRPGLDLYHATLGETYASLAQVEPSLAELTLNQKLNPYHLNYFKSRAKIYLTLATLDPTYNQPAAQELSSARELAPTDPKLAYNLGLVFTRLDHLDDAEQQLLAALSLKPNYHEPYYALTLLYEQTKQESKIQGLLTSAKVNLSTYSAQLKEKIDKYTPR